MPDLYVWIAWAIAALSLVLGAQVLGVTGLLAVLVAALCLATVAVAMSGRRARRRLARRDPRFQATDEVFRDPGSGDLTRVHVDAATGERRYWNEGYMLPTWLRWLVFGVGALLILGGFTAASGGGDGVAAGVEAIVIGAAAMIAAVLQRPRYRSNAAELRHEDAGPGGGENGPLEPRFIPTNEVFVDPTSRRLMRVFVDPRSGERRYRAEG